MNRTRDDTEPPSVDRLIELVQKLVENPVGTIGGSLSTTSAKWYWFAFVRGEGQLLLQECGNCAGKNEKLGQNGSDD